MGDENKTVSDFHAMHSAMLSMEAERLGLYTITYRYHGAKGFQCPPVLNGHVDGAIVGTPHIEVVKALKNRIPMVLMDVPFSLDLADVTMVNVDTRHGFMRLFEFLRENGHRTMKFWPPQKTSVLRFLTAVTCQSQPLRKLMSVRCVLPPPISQNTSNPSV
jgi:hypothetical protein